MKDIKIKMKKTIDNTGSLPSLLEFKPNTFYKFVVIIRPKDGEMKLNEKQKREVMIRDWWISTQEQLDDVLADMKTYCDMFNARLYLLTDRKDTFKTMTSIQMRMFSIQQQMFSSKGVVNDLNDYSKAVRKVPSSCASLAENTDKGGKKWLYDLDTRDAVTLKIVIDRIRSGRNIIIPGKNLEVLNTKNGFHIISDRNYNAYVDDIFFKDRNIPIEIKKNSLTLIYMTWEENE